MHQPLIRKNHNCESCSETQTIIMKLRTILHTLGLEQQKYTDEHQEQLRAKDEELMQKSQEIQDLETQLRRQSKMCKMLYAENQKLQKEVQNGNNRLEQFKHVFSLGSELLTKIQSNNPSNSSRKGENPYSHLKTEISEADENTWLGEEFKRFTDYHNLDKSFRKTTNLQNSAYSSKHIKTNAGTERDRSLFDNSYRLKSSQTNGSDKSDYNQNLSPVRPEFSAQISAIDPHCRLRNQNRTSIYAKPKTEDRYKRSADYWKKLIRNVTKTTLTRNIKTYKPNYGFRS